MQRMHYKVYGGGVPVVSADLAVDETGGNNYALSFAAYTHGILAKLAPWRGIFESRGRSEDGGLRPAVHKSSAIWRGEEEIAEYTYNRDGSFGQLRITDKHNKAVPKPVEKPLGDQTTDVLSATLEVMRQVADTGKCEGADDIFDGKRRFRLIFKDKGETVLPASKLNLYEGKARECVVEVRPIAGKWHDKPRGWLSIQEQGRSAGTMPTVWMAQLKEGSAAVPVRVRVKTDYGTLFMHLAEYRSSDKTLSMEK